SVRTHQGMKVEKSVLIDCPPEECFRVWRNFENLPHFMHHLESVKMLGDKRSHWIAEAPAGMRVEWDAEIINERPNEMIAWRSLEGADVPNAGTVRFYRTSNGRGTEVRVSLEYAPPGGMIGTAFAK